MSTHIPEFISGSRIGRQATCPQSRVLPHCGALGSSYAASFGTAVHAYAEAIAREQSPSVPSMLRGVPLKELELRILAATAFCDEVHIESRIGQRLTDSGYDLAIGDDPAEAAKYAYTAKADLVTISNGCVRVIDYKTGRRSDSHQLQNILTAAAYSACERALLEVWYFDRNTGKVSPVVLGLSMQTVKEKAKGLLEAANALHRPLVMGDHCTWCPAFNMCPAYTALLENKPGSLEAYDRMIKRLQIIKTSVKRLEQMREEEK